MIVGGVRCVVAGAFMLLPAVLHDEHQEDSISQGYRSAGGGTPGELRSFNTIPASMPPLARDELLSIAIPVRSFRPVSAFDASPKRDLTGRRFAFYLAVRPGNAGGCLSLPWWRYFPDRQKLELAFFGQERWTGNMKDYRNKIHPVLHDTGSSLSAPVRCEEVRNGSYRASNLLGASTSISKVNQIVVEIGTVHGALENPDPHFIDVTVDMAPADAKAVISRLKLKIEGELGHWPNGSSIACGVDHPTADMNTIWDTRVDTCIYRGFISRVAFIDGSTGDAIAERVFERPTDDIHGLARR